MITITVTTEPLYNTDSMIYLIESNVSTWTYSLMYGFEYNKDTIVYE